MVLFMGRTLTYKFAVLRTCGSTYRAGQSEAVTKFVVLAQEGNVSRFTASHNTQNMSVSHFRPSEEF